MAKLTKRQRETLNLMKDGPIRADLMHVHPATKWSLIRNGLMTIDREGGGLRWAKLTDAGRAALTPGDQGRAET